jgi:hypothetical protein
VVLRNPFPGFQVPPDIRINNVARRHPQNTEEENRNENASGAQQFSHRGNDIAYDVPTV